MRQLHFFFLLCPLLCLSQPDKVLGEWKKDKALINASYGFCVIDLKNNAVINEYNSHLALIPASTQKIFVTAAALDAWGSDHKFATKIFYTGSIDKTTGVLNGDLILQGGGDPSLQSGYFGKESVTDLWAQIIREKGIREVNGSIIADASFIPPLIPGTWLWEDVSNYFGSVPCGLNYMDNKFTVTFKSKGAGTKAEVLSTSPVYLSTPYDLSADVTAMGIADEAYAYGDPFSYKKVITGTIPPNKEKYDIEVALPDPALLCAEQLCLSLEKLAVKCDRTKIRAIFKPAPVKTSTPLYTHYSPTLDKIVYYTNQHSDNLYCESILKTMGNGESTNGLVQVKKFCVKIGLDTSEVYMKDGCGLARVNTSAAFAQALLLSKIYGKTYYSVFRNSLPVAGKNGSMANIGKGTFIENNLCAKTGYMQRCRSYCGYLRTRSGRELCFSVMVNNYNCTAKEARLKIEKFLVALAEL